MQPQDMMDAAMPQDMPMPQDAEDNAQEANVDDSKKLLRNEQDMCTICESS